MFSKIFFWKSRRSWHNTEKCDAAREAADNMASARGVLDDYGYTRARAHTQYIIQGGSNMTGTDCV